ncbi:hypothetical protein AKJ09_10058 [Labilithrix luteola]|uniref:DifB protein n=1 Tax=Labilithrix luteola TaxID=1391654 RepID=A0A0K1QD88_9BACT|nr:MmcQ/YjbR family DNA-binding protein [Labilithrix luteola]AKV03395.1 hypothetical protein AKJ09_10058 [Labilithrix luteola]
MAAARRSALLAFCRSLPHSTEDVKWGADLVFSIGGKMFAAFDKNGKDAKFGCKVAEDDFVAVTSIDGIEPSKYAARFHWISVKDPSVLPEKEAMALLRDSYELIKAKLPAKLQKQLDGGRAKASAKKAGAKKTTKKTSAKASSAKTAAPTKKKAAKKS